MDARRLVTVLICDLGGNAGRAREAAEEAAAIARRRGMAGLALRAEELLRPIPG